MGELKITQGNVKEAVSIVREAALWVAIAKAPLWDIEELTEDKLLQGLVPDNFYVSWVGDESAASMILQWKDPIYWTHIKEHESGFLHKFCVRRKFAGSTVSKLMVEHAIAQCKAKNINYLRLDTDADRKALRDFYEGLGFSQVGGLTRGSMNFALYEMQLNLPHLS